MTSFGALAELKSLTYDPTASKWLTVNFDGDYIPGATPGTGVTTNCLHPGGVATGLGWNNGWWAVLIAKALRPFIRTPEQGADTVVYLTTSAEVAGINGKYFYNRRELQPSQAARDDDAARRLWRISAELTGVASAV